jgi:hypothetical protein
MAFTIPAWLLPLLVLVVVCFIAGWSSFKTFTEGFFAGSADVCKKEYTTCIESNGSMAACTDTYNTCMSAQGFKGDVVVAPTTAEPPAVVVAEDPEYKKYLEEIKKRNVASPLASSPESTAASYTPHVEGFYPHEMPRQTEGFSIQQQVRAPGT